MLLNYLKLATRLLIRNPLFTFINVFGLSVGFAVFFILWQYSQKELMSDRFVKDYKNIYRSCTHLQWSDDKVKWEEKIAGASPFWLDRIIEKYEKFESKTYYLPQQLFSEQYIRDHGRDFIISHTEQNGEKRSFPGEHVIYAQPNFLDFFSIAMTKGSAVNALSVPDAMVISERTAIKFFGSKDVLGRVVSINDRAAFRITGIFKDLPENTHLNFEVALSTLRIQTDLEKLHQEGRTRFHPFCYYKFYENTDVKTVEDKINKFSKDEVTYLVYANTPFSQAKVLFQRLEDISFENYIFDNHKVKSRYFLYMLRSGSLVILVMAWINAVSLTISFNKKRSKELGIRKTIGANSGSLILQFFTMSTLVNGLAILLALTMIQAIKSPAEEFLRFYIGPWSSTDYPTVMIFSAAVVIAILVTSFFPAYVTVNNSPKTVSDTFKNKISLQNLTPALTTVQFTCAIIFVVLVYVVHKQFTFILAKDIGLDRKQVLVADLPFIRHENFNNDVKIFSEEVNKLAGVDQFTVSNSLAVDLPEARVNIARVKGEPRIALDCNGGVDENFLPFFKIKLLAGRNFRPDLPSDRSAILLSEGAILRLGIQNPDDAIGMRIQEATGFLMQQDGVEVIGVFEDYNLRPFLNESNSTNYGGKPGIVLTYKDFLAPSLFPKKISFRLEMQNATSTIAKVNDIYNAIFPGQIFHSYFLDEQIHQQYATYAVSRNQMFFFTLLAVAVACLGLFGMINNKAIGKTKEIAVRKVLGATISDIFRVLLNSTIKQMIVASFLGVPLVYILSLRYLQKFSERIDLQWWHYAIPVVLLLFIMFVTIAWVLFKVARTNPVESLRNE